MFHGNIFFMETHTFHGNIFSMETHIFHGNTYFPRKNIFFTYLRSQQLFVKIVSPEFLKFWGMDQLLATHQVVLVGPRPLLQNKNIRFKYCAIILAVRYTTDCCFHTCDPTNPFTIRGMTLCYKNAGDPCFRDSLKSLFEHNRDHSQERTGLRMTIVGTCDRDGKGIKYRKVESKNFGGREAKIRNQLLLICYGPRTP